MNEDNIPGTIPAEYSQYGGQGPYEVAAPSTEQFGGGGSNPFMEEGQPTADYGQSTTTIYGQTDDGQSSIDYSQYGQSSSVVVPTESVASVAPSSIYSSPPLPPQPPPIPPAPPQFGLSAAPLIPQRTRTPDPYSWEAQENAISVHGTAIVPPRPPPIGPSPGRTPEEQPSAEEGQKGWVKCGR
jgi:hypothetical protein